MNWLDALGYAASASVLFTYWLFVTGRNEGGAMNVANALAGPVILTTTILSRGWQPVLLMTAAFTSVAWYGVVRRGRD